MIERWNAVVQRGDTVWHLGDFAWYDREDVFHQLNGEKHLIIGNHDTKRTIKMPWTSQHDYHELKVEHEGSRLKLVLFHYPVEEWNGFYKGSIHLHGHTHGRTPAIPRRFDVGADVHDFTPVTLAQLLA